MGKRNKSSGRIPYCTTSMVYTEEESEFLKRLDQLKIDYRRKHNRWPTNINIYHLAIEVHREFNLRKEMNLIGKCKEKAEENQQSTPVRDRRSLKKKSVVSLVKTQAVGKAV